MVFELQQLCRNQLPFAIFLGDGQFFLVEPLVCQYSGIVSVHSFSSIMLITLQDCMSPPSSASLCGSAAACAKMSVLHKEVESSF